jgi:hypothetical protein
VGSRLRPSRTIRPHFIIHYAIDEMQDKFKKN